METFDGSLSHFRRKSMKDKMRFPWEDPSVSMFHVWVGQPELAWARKAWEALEQKGLTLFSNELERTQVLIRAMTLGTIYREFCDLAHDDAWEAENLEWASEMGLNPFRVAQLVGDEFEVDEDHDETRLLDFALYSLIDDEREDICKALCEGFGGEAMLFVSLWNSMYGELPIDYDPDDPECFPESPEEVLNYDVTGQKVQAYSWITEGMPRVR
jgi:hypothetical protein